MVQINLMEEYHSKFTIQHATVDPLPRELNLMLESNMTHSFPGKADLGSLQP